MRQKETYLVVAFDTTTDAMQMDKAGKKDSALCGRLIPIPRQLSAGCGMAWRESPENEIALKDILEREAIEHAGIYTMQL